ncbi:hypothetical protein J437_LFUL004993 [Ladona fulva]|uniref:Uncharacterized protein n=1 Tax=Ladona fulva TaxID=123851 RepID=A0A8K0NTX3_LADFU|nr:hypothetical protein J437_LFUL004993 [Ladona fulva]
MPPIGMDLPWERTQPSASSELHQEGPREEAGVSGDASNSVIEDGNDTLPVPLYGIMTDEISSDVDLMLGGDGGGDGVTSEELVMWRLTNHDRRKGELETDEELLSRNRRTPREKKGGRKEAAKKKKKKDEEGEEQERQRRRKGMRRARWRERRRKAKEERENRERGGDSRRNKKGKESNPRPQRRRHQGHQFSTRERFLEITESVAAKKARRPRGGAVPKKPPVSRPRAKSSRIRGPGSMPRDGISSGEGGVSSGSGILEDGAARSERSANLSHITGTARKIQMVVKNRNLQIDPWGRVSGAEDEDSDYRCLTCAEELMPYLIITDA